MCIDDGGEENDSSVTEDKKELWVGKVIYFRILVLLKVQALKDANRYYRKGLDLLIMGTRSPKPRKGKPYLSVGHRVISKE